MAETKLLKDLIALSKTGSFTRAAELRNVTHPAFSRRIRELERWAGTLLVDRSKIPVRLTQEGRELLVTAEYIVARLNTVSRKIRSQPGSHNYSIRIATGRYLASTLVADWACDMSDVISRDLSVAVPVQIRTGSTPDMVALLQREEVDFLCCYEHPNLSLPVATSNFQYLQLGTDRFVPVCCASAYNTASYNLDDEFTAIPHVTYVNTLSLHHILSDHLRSSSYALEPVAHCDSVEVAWALIKKGRGIGWLPWSVVEQDCNRGTLRVLGGRQNEVPFEVRLYRSKEPLSVAAEMAWKKTTR